MLSPAPQHEGHPPPTAPSGRALHAILGPGGAGRVESPARSETEQQFMDEVSSLRTLTAAGPRHAAASCSQDPRHHHFLCSDHSLLHSKNPPEHKLIPRFSSTVNQ
ncbi:unnamed protein product [Gadus morhua 'NCC']